MGGDGVKRAFQGVLLLALMSLLAVSAGAQPSPGAICVATFADANGDGTRDPAEGPLGGVNVNLATGGAIIATHVTAPDETQHCFDNLSAGLYTVTFTDAPLYRITTPYEGTFALDAGQRLTINEFGAVPIPVDAVRAEVVAQVEDDEPLDSSTRLLLSIGGAMLVMLFLIGFGAVILGFGEWRRSRRRRAELLPPPADIRPPSR